MADTVEWIMQQHDAPAFDKELVTFVRQPASSSIAIRLLSNGRTGGSTVFAGRRSWSCS